MPTDRKREPSPAAAEEELLSAFRQAHSPEAFEPLVLLNLNKVRGVISRIVLNPADTDDLVQETFIRAYQKFDSFKGNANFSTWLCRIAVTRSLNHLRKFRRQLPGENALANQAAHVSEQPDQRLMRDEQNRQLDEAMAGLPSHLRAVLVLSVLEDMEAGEVARVCNCSKATVYWRLHRARKELRKRLQT